MEDKLFFIGLVLIFLGILLTIISSFLGKKKIEFAFGGFIGPIPFGWATNYYLLIILFFLIFVTLFFFTQK